MKRIVTLIVALLFIIVITRLENYLSQTGVDTLAADDKQVDSYLSDFSMMAIRDDGSIGYRLAGRHLAYSQGEQQSHVIDAVLETSDGYKVTTNRLDFDQQTQEVFTDSEVFITTPSGTMQSTGLTGKLDENLLKFDADVRSTYKIN